MSDIMLTGIDVERWRASPEAFIEECLINPETDQPFELLPAERDFLAHAFKTDENGRLLYPEQVFGAPKKSGKTGFAALLILTFVLLHGGRYAEGYALANDEEQASSRVFAQIKKIVECSPLLKREAYITSDRITFAAFHHATVRTLASNYATVAGANPTISCFDELWAYTSERSQRLWDEMVPSPLRPISLRLTVTFAGFEGESQPLEALYKRGLQQQQVAPNLYAGNGVLMFWSHEPIAPWQTPSWLAEMRKAMRPNQYIRQIENRFVTTESAFVDMANWDRCVQSSWRPVIQDKSMYCWVGVDASFKHDSTAVVGVTWDRASKQVRQLWHRIFQPTPDKPLQFEATIDATLKELSHRFQFQQILFDPWQMQSVAQRLTAARLPVQEFPQTSGNLTAASQNLYDLIQSGGLVLYADEPMRLAASRAVAIETSRGWRISKEKASHKIDVIVALAMACYAAVQGSSEPYFDRSYSGFNDDDAVAKDNQPSYAVETLRSAILNGYGWGAPKGGRWS